MNKLAYDNLKLLDEAYSDSLFLISDNNILNLIEKDNFDTCSKIKSLEYPIYFTYHHILNIVDYDKDISYLVIKIAPKLFFSFIKRTYE